MKRNLHPSILLLSCCLLSAYALFGQGSVTLNNPSFEDIPAQEQAPQGWTSCGNNSTPDVMPGPYQVYSLAPDGTTYMGLITREDSWEMTGQAMQIPFRKGECYDVSLWLARAVSGYSGYNGATRLRVWAGNSMCDKQQLLFESQTIEHREFKKYHFYFWTKEAYKFILFEAYYKKDYTTPYNGNILVDGVSAFKPCLRASDSDEQEGF